MSKDCRTGPSVETGLVIPDGHRLLACYDDDASFDIEKLNARRQPFPAILHIFGSDEDTPKQVPIIITGYSVIGLARDSWVLYFRKVEGRDYGLYHQQPYEEDEEESEEGEGDKEGGKKEKEIQYRKILLIPNYYCDKVHLPFDPSQPGYYNGSYAYVTIPISEETEEGPPG